MKLIDMKLPKEKKKLEAIAIAEDKYPYGLRINLNNYEINKLGIDVSKLKVGSKVKVLAEGEITNIFIRQTMEKKEDKSMSIQLQKINIDTTSSEFDEGWKDATSTKK